MGDVAAFEPVYLEAEVAEILRVRLKVIQRERYAGRLGFIRVGNQVRIRQSDVQAYLARQAQCPESAPAPASPDAPDAPDGTSSDLTGEAALSAARRGRQIAEKLKQSSPPSSSNGTNQQADHPSSPS